MNWLTNLLGREKTVQQLREQSQKLAKKQDAIHAKRREIAREIDRKLKEARNG